MAGRTYDVSLRGDASGIVSAFGTAGNAAAAFARMLGPGGVALGAVQGFVRALSPVRVGLALAATAMVQFATSSVRAFSQVESAAVQSALSVHRSVAQMRADLGALSGGAGFSAEGMAALGGLYQAGVGRGRIRATTLGVEAGAIYGTDASDEALRLARGAAASGLTVDEYARRTGLTGALAGQLTPQQRSRLFAARNQAAQASFGAGINAATGLGNISIEFDRSFLGIVGRWLSTGRTETAGAPGGFTDAYGFSDRVNAFFGHDDIRVQEAAKRYDNRADYWTRMLRVGETRAAIGDVRFARRLNAPGLPGITSQLQPTRLPGQEAFAEARGADRALLQFARSMQDVTATTGQAFRQFRLDLADASTSVGDFGAAANARARELFNQAVTSHYAARGFGPQGAPSGALSDLPPLPAWLEALRPRAYPDRIEPPSTPDAARSAVPAQIAPVVILDPQTRLNQHLDTQGDLGR